MSDEGKAGEAPTGRIPLHVFDTAELPPEDVYAAYRELVAFAYDVADPEPGFFARVLTYRLDRMVLHDTDQSGQSFDRSETRARHDGLEHFALIALIEGEIAGDFDGRAFRAGPGNLLFADLTRPGFMRTTAVRMMTLGLGRELMDPLSPAGADLHGQVVAGASGRLFTDYLTSLAERLPGLKPDQLPEITRATLSLLGACLTGAGRADRDRAAVESLTLERVRRFIQANLGSRDLSPERIAAELKISRSALYRLFVAAGGVSQYIWSQRLAQARALLSGAGPVPRMAELAFSLGFASEAHFSRAFRKTYGASPSEYIAERRKRPDRQHAFESWVKDLG